MEKSLNTFYCPKCGGTNVHIIYWADAWCGDCENYIDLDTIQDLWDDFSEIPINSDDEIEKDFLCFPAGTSRFDVWHWFDERCPNGLAVDLMGEELK